ncbi:GntR family transcriptional regulator/MocR family aminotransferase [Rhodoligotrophos appendicifer]|uniref:MocR-like pyridoxine biosynthesis transcription factor PdxR n=1 Tax=Rhodoligotrophos appendicifer TaxID=987056 RepID=UPI001186063E|nr:PLP-dependent aminotransferase family protein [Rhodoligotrophos appendicifer]
MVKYSGGALLPALSVDKGAATPLVVQLSYALREAILSGAIAAGARLPSSRTLARDLGLSRTTVVAVYDQLTSEGLIDSRVGAGAFVSVEVNVNVPTAIEPQGGELGRQPARLARIALGASQQFLPRLAHLPEHRAFITGMPALEAFPVALWARLTARCWRGSRGQMLGYPDPAGLKALRHAVAAHLRLNRGILCEPESVFIVNGAQEAFNRIGSMLLDPGDPVWFENPGAIGARNSLFAAGARLVPVPVDDEGISVAEGLRTSPDFRLAFVTPSHQHPTGVTMSLSRRFELLQAAEQADAWIIEDDYDGEFFYSGRPPPTLKSIDKAGRVIYVGTFSKSLFPALRLGFMVAPPALVEAFDRVARATQQGASTNQQCVVASFIGEGHFATHIRRMGKLYAERQEVLMDEARDHLSGVLDVVRAESGIQTIGRFAAGIDEVAVAEAAARRGIVAAPISRFCLEPVENSGLVLGFSACSPREIKAGVGVLAQILSPAQRQAHPTLRVCVPSAGRTG